MAVAVGAVSSPGGMVPSCSERPAPSLVTREPFVSSTVYGGLSSPRTTKEALPAIARASNGPANAVETTIPTQRTCSRPLNSRNPAVAGASPP